VQEAQSAFGAIESALRNHQPSQAPTSKIAQLSKQPVPESDGSIMQSLLDGLSSEQQVQFFDDSMHRQLPPLHNVTSTFSLSIADCPFTVFCRCTTMTLWTLQPCCG
jgi:hypothetical protein